MTLRAVLRTSTVVVLCLVLAIPVSSRDIGPSKGEVAGLIVAAVVAVVGVGVLIYYGTHKHAGISGCVDSDGNGLSVRNGNDKKSYALSGDLAGVTPGRQMALKGKKLKDSSGRLTFQVQKLTKDNGECRP